MKYIVCYSGGHSSALVAIEAVRKAGKESVILLNHDISSEAEHADIKRFKQEVADYLDLPITYANADGFETLTPLEVCRRRGVFVNPSTQQALCTYYLKTEPFYKWLKENYPSSAERPREDVKILYGFDADEPDRITRKVGVMATMGHYTDYPLAFWKRTIENTESIGISRPLTYKIFKHANCFPCLKAGKQHWYIAYCLKRKQFDEAAVLEKEIGHTLLKGVSLEECVPEFERMVECGMCPNDRENSASFWAKVNNAIPDQQTLLPCDCAIL